MSEYDDVHFLEAAERVDGAAISLRSLKEVLSPWVQSLIRVLSWSTPTSAARGRISQLAIWPFGVLLLHVCVEGWVREISFLAVLALEVSSLIVVFGPSLAHLPRAVLVFIFIIRVFRVRQALQVLLAWILVVIIHSFTFWIFK